MVAAEGAAMAAMLRLLLRLALLRLRRVMETSAIPLAPPRARPRKAREVLARGSAGLQPASATRTGLAAA
jgi:hypothetical protein